MKSPAMKSAAMKSTAMERQAVMAKNAVMERKTP